MSDKLILADDSVIELETGASLFSLGVVSENKEKMMETWELLTKENLKTVQVKNGDGLVVANYKNLVLDSETSIVNEDGSVHTKFCLREKTQTELDIEEMKKDLSAINEVMGG